MIVSHVKNSSWPVEISDIGVQDDTTGYRYLYEDAIKAVQRGYLENYDKSKFRLTRDGILFLEEKEVQFRTVTDSLHATFAQIEEENGSYSYRVVIEDELKSSSPKQALTDTLHRIQNEETVASVESHHTGEVFHYEIQTGERLDDES